MRNAIVQHLGIYTGICYPLIVFYIVSQCNEGELNENEREREVKVHNAMLEKP